LGMGALGARARGARSLLDVVAPVVTPAAPATSVAPSTQTPPPPAAAPAELTAPDAPGAPAPAPATEDA
jgi:hypothetical protein